MAIGPGFEIKNETQMRLQMSLDQVGPLYFGLVDPGKTFVRDTGAVWFTIKAAVNIDPKDQITAWDAVWPVGVFTVGVLAAAVAVAVTAGGAGPAIAAAGGGASGGAGAASTAAGLTAAQLAGVSTLAPALVGMGVPAGTALTVSGFAVGGTLAAGGAGAKAIQKAFSKDNTIAKKAGCYAGPPWPFRENRKKYAIRGGPKFTKMPDGTVNLTATPLHVVQL